MSEFTEDELEEFDLETARAEARDQVTRISGRLAVRRLIALHGKDKCDAMFAEILRRESARTKPKKKGRP